MSPQGSRRHHASRTVVTGLVVALLMLMSWPQAGLALPRSQPPAPSPPPTVPLPAAIVVHPDSDPLGKPGLQVAAGLSRPPAVPATGWMVVDLDSGDVLAAQDARAQLAPASTLKLLTALTLSPRMPNDDGLYTATPEAETVDGTRAGLVAGSVYRAKDLLHGLLMASGNDTAVLLGQTVGGDGPSSSLMLAEAARLGATDTDVGNTSGLDAPGQVTSARDLALFGRAVLADPRLAAIVATREYDFPKAGTDFGPGRQYFPIYSHNKMLGVYPGTLGVKNGFTKAARGSFVGAADHNGRRLMCTMLHAEGHVADTCAAMLDWAFAQPAPAAPVTTLQASVGASAPPAPVLASAGVVAGANAAGATSGTTRQARQDAFTAAGDWHHGLPRWMTATLVLAGFVLAAVVGVWALGRSPGRVALDDGPDL